jgi:hypothetical protein
LAPVSSSEKGSFSTFQRNTEIIVQTDAKRGDVIRRFRQAALTLELFCRRGV